MTYRSADFEDFRLVPDRRLLLNRDKVVRLGSRALEILIALVERPGELVSKEELIERVWPNTYIEEVNLRVHVAALRKALGDGTGGKRFVANIPGRGYSFVAPVTVADVPHLSLGETDAPEPQSNLPPPIARLVGRDDVVRAIVEQLKRSRFLTVVGSGGMGKTTVALAAADLLRQSYEDNVWFVDLAPITDASLVPSTLASMLGLTSGSADPLPAIAAFMHAREALILLDSCEHVVEAAAAMAEAIFKKAPRVHILATSREPLRAEGEHVLRLGPLAFPAPDAAVTAADALTYPSIRLFAERAAATMDEFELTTANVSIVADICRKLDGIPLAIELAASRVDAFGLRELAVHLDERFRLLMHGRRTGAERHKTLGTALDWSYEYLSELERTVLRRLSTFVGGFAVDAACAVAADKNISETHVIEAIADLVAKSLVTAELGETEVQYRLFDTTRAYARARLEASGELAEVTERHAQYQLHDLERLKVGPLDALRTKQRDALGRHIDNVRSVVDWALGPEGDAELGVQLTIAALPLWLELSLLEECRWRAETALAHVKADGREADRQAMQLSLTLGWMKFLTVRGSGPEANAAWTRALEIADALGDIDYQLRAIWGLWLGTANNGELRATLAWAEKFHDLAEHSADPNDVFVGDRLIAFSHHLLGHQATARKHVDSMLRRYVSPNDHSDIRRFQFDQRVMAESTFSFIAWLQGYPRQAMKAVERGVAASETLGHIPTLCNALAFAACPVALLAGDLGKAERYIEMLIEQAEIMSRDLFKSWASCFRGILLIRRGEMADGLQYFDAAFTEFAETRYFRHLRFLSLLAEAHGRAGQIGHGLAVIDKALERSQATEENWCRPEILRVKGELTLLDDGPRGDQAAEALFQDSLDWARRQDALSWELRTATSLARLHHRLDRTPEAAASLSAVYDRFTEGFETADLKTAKSLLDSMT